MAEALNASRSNLNSASKTRKDLDLKVNTSFDKKGIFAEPPRIANKLQRKDLVDDLKRISEARPPIIVDKFKKLRTKTERDLKKGGYNSRLRQSNSRDLSPLIFAQSLDPN